MSGFKLFVTFKYWQSYNVKKTDVDPYVRGPVERENMNGNTINRPESSLDIREILSLIGRRKWLLIIPVILVTAVAFGASYHITPEYDSSCIIEVEDQVQLDPSVQSLVGAQNARRQSRGMAQDQLKSIYNNVTSSLYASMLNQRMHLGNQPGIQKQARADMLLQSNLTMERAVVNVLQLILREDVSVEWAASDQIKIRVESNDPILAKNIADNLADIYISEKLKQELGRIRKPEDWSEEQLRKFEDQLAEQMAEKTRIEQTLIAIEPNETISSESNRSEITAEIDRAQQDINDLRNQERQVLARLSSLDGLSDGQPKLNTSNEITTLTGRIKDELSSVGQLLVKFPWSDPQVLDHKLRLNRILDDIEREYVRLVDEQYDSATEQEQRDIVEFFGIETNLNSLYAKRPYLEAALEELETRVSMIPDLRAQLAEVEQRILATSDLRERFQRQQESSAISQAFAHDMSASKYRVVEPAKAALRPISPDKKKITLMGLLLGFVLGGATVLLVELFDSSFRRVDDVETHLGLPVLATLPNFDSMKRV